MPKITGNSLAEHREITREAIFDAFSHLLTTKGFDSISMSALATEANIGRTALYNHFQDKEDILVAYVEYEMHRYLTKLKDNLSKATSPEEKLRVYARAQLLAKRGYLFSPGAPLRDVVSERTALALREHVKTTSQVLRGILEECVDLGLIPDQDLGVTVQLVHSSLTVRHIPATEPERTAFFEATEAFVLRSIGIRESGAAGRR
ncbi:MAG: TetR/AcrR family transcriptional regulator [Actinomycetaceae bacterium]|nr:TetR/AcrR family transcriptional regulator [Actinomycetaceae bacterium]